MAKIIKLQVNGKPVAQCDCDCQEFYILLNGFGDTWDEIKGTECVDCGNIIDWVKVVREDDGKS